ncbi:hypothetical protein LEP1GSC071_2446 [Leptospira santarosai str. JET]|nr:hypothetical protein LEP1GSC071_2446 [Leptospira santarosai str. JET]OLY62187.1 hypothetical protein BV917_01130 [Leptospira santarosai serovar Guaricura]ONF89297.1 hypothetical protein BWD13_02695 [Leptospira santarosai serovar Grippotyphosa]
MCLIGNSWFSFQGNPTFQFLKQIYSIIFIRRSRKYSRIEFYKKKSTLVLKKSELVPKLQREIISLLGDHHILKNACYKGLHKMFLKQLRI